jgi:phosphohistidine phosphatase
MSADLILWRHADAGDPGEGQALDLQRPLSAKGEKQAARMSTWLERQLPETARVICSPAARAEQTVVHLGRKYKLRDELAPGNDPAAVLELVQWGKFKGPTLIVGHQPMLGELAAMLLGLPQASCSIKKGSVWWLRQRVRSETSQVVVVTVQVPELL